MKILKRLMLTVVVLLIVVVTAAYSVSSYRISQKLTFSDTPVVTMDSATIARGEFWSVRSAVRALPRRGPRRRPHDRRSRARQVHAPNLTSGRGSVTAALSMATSSMPSATG
jgi:hypothetical protein